MSTTNVHKAATDHDHPGPWQYVQIATFLAVITAAEVALYYIKMPDALLVFLLFVFSAIKFYLVVRYFMHLKFDAPIYRKLFLIGIILAFTVYTVVLLTFGLLR
ncbi:MAG TPA: cytochrome C oxidase subunit IV family protein [Actinomycetota bacterium]|nr:cytochrome C oxidase subunit IV family protein [Actinomycetota bacterium]